MRHYLRPSRDMIGVGGWLLRILGFVWFAGVELVIMYGVVQILAPQHSLYPPRLLRLGLIPAVGVLCAAGVLAAVLLRLWLRFVPWLQSKQLALFGYDVEAERSEAEHMPGKNR